MNVRRYESGQLVAGYVPLELPANPWVRKPLPVVQAPQEEPKLRPGRRKPSKFGFEKMAIGERIHIPRLRISSRTHASRMRAVLSKRRHYWPERYSVIADADGVTVTRTK